MFSPCGLKTDERRKDKQQTKMTMHRRSHQVIGTANALHDNLTTPVVGVALVKARK